MWFDFALAMAKLISCVHVAATSLYDSNDKADYPFKFAGSLLYDCNDKADYPLNFAA